MADPVPCAFKVKIAGASRFNGMPYELLGTPPEETTTAVSAPNAGSGTSKGIRMLT